ncbi:MULTISPECIES: hypothetical protein [Luteibacter]|uniref:hypothetical protein n=1 Tax=Luteibacter TaxID=242605 RepID=UPI000563217A|nr:MULTISPECIES: hypothetical protein [unclassified Luteibacter]
MDTFANDRNAAANGESTTSRGPFLTDNTATSILLQIKDAIPRIETELRYLTDLAAATKKDVDDLKTWKSLILGGAGLLAMLFGLYKAASGSIHVTFGDTPPVAAIVRKVS